MHSTILLTMVSHTPPMQWHTPPVGWRRLADNKKNNQTVLLLLALVLLYDVLHRKKTFSDTEIHTQMQAAQICLLIFWLWNNYMYMDLVHKFFGPNLLACRPSVVGGQ